MLDRASASLERADALVRQTIGLMRDRATLIEGVCVAACVADVEALSHGGLTST